MKWTKTGISETCRLKNMNKQFMLFYTGCLVKMIRSQRLQNIYSNTKFKHNLFFIYPSTIMASGVDFRPNMTIINQSHRPDLTQGEKHESNSWS